MTKVEINSKLHFFPLSNSYDDGFKPPAEIMEAAKKWYKLLYSIIM